MDFFQITFPASGVSTWAFIPPAAAFIVSFFSSMGGVSGAFLLLPFQMSVLNYTSPSVSGTNQLFNVVAIPGGVWRYIREKRMVWPLAWAIIIGTLPGVFIGVWLRLEYLPDPERFKLFAGLVLLYVGLRLLADAVKGRRPGPVERRPAGVYEDAGFLVANARFSLKRIEFFFGGQRFSCSTPGVLFVCFLVGIIGGIYGVGGGSVIAPFLVMFFHFPVYAVAGAALTGTFVTSIAGVMIYQFLAYYYAGLSVAPDWRLGLLFGAGGFVGMYLGARCQKHVPAGIIKLILCGCVFFVAGRYLIGFFA